MTLASVVHRIAADPIFAAQMLQEPRSALLASDLTLDDEGIAAVVDVLRSRPAWAELCSPAMDPPETYPWYGYRPQP